MLTIVELSSLPVSQAIRMVRRIVRADKGDEVRQFVQTIDIPNCAIVDDAIA